jgi:hypothetical protein
MAGLAVDLSNGQSVIVAPFARRVEWMHGGTERQAAFQRRRFWISPNDVLPLHQILTERQRRSFALSRRRGGGHLVG